MSVIIKLNMILKQGLFLKRKTIFVNFLVKIFNMKHSFFKIIVIMKFCKMKSWLISVVILEIMINLHIQRQVIYNLICSNLYLNLLIKANKKAHYLMKYVKKLNHLIKAIFNLKSVYKFKIINVKLIMKTLNLIWVS